MKKIKSFFKQLFHRITEDDIFGLAAQLAFFFLLSLFPFLLFLITLIGYLPLDERVVTEFIGTYAPGQIMDLIHDNIGQLVNNQNGGLLSLSVIGTLWSASNGIKAIMKAFNRAYEVDEDRSFVFGRLIAIVLTIAMVLVICVAFVLPIFGKMFGEYFFSFFGYSDEFIQFWTMMRWVVSSIIFFVVLTLLYKLAPNKHIDFIQAIWGAIFATIGWQLVSLAFSFYVSTIGNYSAMYGSLGAVIILMIWFYLSGIIIIIGGVINAVIMQMKQKE